MKTDAVDKLYAENYQKEAAREAFAAMRIMELTDPVLRNVAIRHQERSAYLYKCARRFMGLVE
jgi:hypothetical protein